MKLVIRLTRQEQGRYVAWCPSLPGCRVYAESREQAERRITREIHGYLASLEVAGPVHLESQVLGASA